MMKKTDRHDWVCAHSVGVECMSEAGFAAIADAGITEVELSSGGAAPYFDVLDYPHRAKELSALGEVRRPDFVDPSAVCAHGRHAAVRENYDRLMSL